MSTFTIYPAIDLQGGHCVRLLQGRADAATVCDSDPVYMAQGGGRVPPRFIWWVWTGRSGGTACRRN